MKRKMSRSTFLLGVGGGGHEYSRTQRQRSTRPAQKHPVGCRRRPPALHDGLDAPNQAGDKGSATSLLGPRTFAVRAARVSLLTGLSVTTHKCDTNETWPKFEGSSHGLGERSVARYLKDAAYATGHFGKYINGRGGASAVPLLGSVVRNRGRRLRLPPDPPGGQRGRHLDGHPRHPLRVGGPDVRPVRAREAGLPWFAQYCPTIPHDPYTPSARSRHLYDGARRRAPSVNEKDMSDKPKWMRDLRPHRFWEGPARV